MHRLLALHESQRVQHVGNLLGISLRQTDDLLVFDQRRLIRPAVGLGTMPSEEVCR
ncbi:MAG: hypothetical protein K0R61_4987 [Microvirga sp.]|jgi:hypothetical protein|nr:hypothetical protein [Microvirga sp.]